jgi:uncharacterized membrane protein YdcZ (DUF606 family)
VNYIGVIQLESRDSMTDSFDNHLLDAGHRASKDFDAWVLKLGTAGMTLVLGVAALVNMERLGNLILAGGLFSGSLVAGLLSLRLSADGLKRMSEDDSLTTKDVPQFTWVTGLNWVAFITLSLAFVMLAVFVGFDAIPMKDGG